MKDKIRDEFDEGLVIKEEVDLALERIEGKALADIEKECSKYVAASVAVIGRMMPKALEVIYEIMNGNKKSNSDATRLQAAKYVLGVFGVTERRKVEHEHTDKDLPNKKHLMEEFTNELRKELGKVEHKSIAGGNKESQEEPILIKPL